MATVTKIVCPTVTVAAGLTRVEPVDVSDAVPRLVGVMAALAAGTEVHVEAYELELGQLAVQPGGSRLAGLGALSRRNRRQHLMRLPVPSRRRAA